MCGINGFILKDQSSIDENIKKIHRMNSLITYRGPDSEGHYTDSYASIGMRRLSVIDIETGGQPIYSQDDSLIIVFNGEIYNYKELRDELLKKGYLFKTKGDTEVILHLYEEYGYDCLQKLNGMFCFAIYNKNSKNLFIARDRAGEKPLYYYKDQEKFIFASELKSIIRSFDIKKEINLDALNQYFSLTYIPAPLTIFNNIYKLEAGNYLIFDNNELIIKKYWDINSLEDNFIYDYQKCKQLLRAYFFESVQKRMISDVPLGAFLSGGIDSSIIVGIMSKISKKPIETFTIGFKNKELDESYRAEVVSKFNKTNHHIHYLEFYDIQSQIDTILDTFDEPFSDSSSLATYFVSRYAKDYVTVVLTGDGGDELFGGYSKYQIDYYLNIYNKIPKAFREGIFEKLILNNNINFALKRKIRKVILNNDKDAFTRRKDLMFLGFNDKERAGLLKNYTYTSDSFSNISNAYYKNKMFDELTNTLYTDFKLVLEGDMLVKVDRMSMLNSLEARVPFLDKNIIELAFKIPSNYKIKGNIQKYILKDTFSDFIPQKILKKSKKGFRVPIDQWLKGPLKNNLNKFLDKEFIENQKIFNYSYINELKNSNLLNINNAYSLWAIYVFQNWYLKYL